MSTPSGSFPTEPGVSANMMARIVGSNGDRAIFAAHRGDYNFTVPFDSENPIETQYYEVLLETV